MPYLLKNGCQWASLAVSMSTTTSVGSPRIERATVAEVILFGELTMNNPFVAVPNIPEEVMSHGKLVQRQECPDCSDSKVPGGEQLPAKRGMQGENSKRCRGAITKARSLTLCLALGVLQASAGARAQATSANASGQNRSGTPVGNPVMTVEVPFVMLVPMQVQADPNLVNGCWVRLFSGPNYTGNDELTIAGPINMQSLKTVMGIDWRHKADSLKVGPKATVQVFENELFRNKNLTFHPNQQVPSLAKDLGFLHSVDSLKINCAK